VCVGGQALSSLELNREALLRGIMQVRPGHGLKWRPGYGLMHLAHAVAADRGFIEALQTQSEDGQSRAFAVAQEGCRVSSAGPLDAAGRRPRDAGQRT
jgi:hypothetical protein